MDYSFVPTIPQLNVVPARLIEKGLLHIVVGVGTAVHDTSVAYDYSLLIAVYGYFHENILEGHLHSHDVDLEPDCVL